MKEQVQNPRSLADQCRLQIRQRCGPGVHQKISQLTALPDKLKGFLRFEDLLQHDPPEDEGYPDKCPGCYAYYDECTCMPEDYDYLYDDYFNEDPSSSEDDE